MAATETKPTVYEAWSHVMAAVQSVGKTGFNTQQQYPFRGIDATMNAVGPALREHGVIVMPGLLKASYRDVEVGAKRTTMRETTVEVRYTIIGPAGDRLIVPDDPNFGVVPGESLDSGDKGTSKAMSVAYRTFLLQALTIPTGVQDPDEHSYERSARPADTGNPADLLGEGELLAKDAKARLVKAVGGDKVAAMQAWHAAGLDGHWKVTAQQLADVITEATVNDNPIAEPAANGETESAGSAPTTSGEGEPPLPQAPAPSPGTPTALQERKKQEAAVADQADHVKGGKK